LIRAFPKLATDEKQRKAAGRWARIAQMHFRGQMTRGQIAEEMGLPITSVKRAIECIRRTAKGLTVAGVPRKRWSASSNTL
jgi:hypothetical protein